MYSVRVFHYMDAQQYYESLLAQGYTPEDSTKYTQEHYPDFGQESTPAAPEPAAPEPVAPAPMAIPAPGELPAPAPMPMPMPGAQPMMMGMPGQAGQPVVIQQKSQGGIWRIFNGIFGIIFSLAMLYVSNLVREMWDVIGDELSKEIDNLSTLERVLIDDFISDLESMISTFSTIYTVVMILSCVMLVVSIIQFMNKPWGGKAFLGAAALLLVVLLGAAMYEYTAINNLIDDVNELEDGEDIPPISFMETPGFIGSACTSVCFIVFALLAYLGRHRDAPMVELQI